MKELGGKQSQQKCAFSQRIMNHPPMEIRCYYTTPSAIKQEEAAGPNDDHAKGAKK